MEYIIGKSRTENGFKLFLGCVTDKSKGIVSGYNEKDCHIKKKRALFEIPEADVVLRLPAKSDLPPGKVYGFDVSKIFTGKKIEHEFFGTINFFYKINKEVGTRLMKAFDNAAKILRKAGFSEPVNTVWEVCGPGVSGKWAGYYKHSTDEKMPHRFSIKPEHYGGEDMLYIVLHEFAHYVHSNLLTQPKINATWIRLFNTSIKRANVKKEESQDLLELLIDGEELPSQFKRGLEEDRANGFNWIIRTIKQEHAVSIRELDTLFEANEKEEIRNLWPVRTLYKKDLKPVVSEYACTNVRELWAEAFSFYFLTNKKKELPESIIKLVEKSMQMAKANQEKP